MHITIRIARVIDSHYVTLQKLNDGLFPVPILGDNLNIWRSQMSSGQKLLELIRKIIYIAGKEAKLNDVQVDFVLSAHSRHEIALRQIVNRFAHVERKVFYDVTHGPCI